jgi:hypothetical protein
MARFRIAVVGILAVLAIPLAASAGGWALASFDEVPGGFQAGVTYDLEYTILQHGVTPVDVGNSQVRIVGADGSVSAFDATPTGETGRYSVSITFPASGTWHWEVDMGDFGPHQMGAVEVAPAMNAAAASGSWLRWLLPLALVLVIGLVAIQVAEVTRTRRSTAGLSAE